MGIMKYYEVDCDCCGRHLTLSVLKTMKLLLADLRKSGLALVRKDGVFCDATCCDSYREEEKRARKQG
jgi:hypothetical protein